MSLPILYIRLFEESMEEYEAQLKKVNTHLRQGTSTFFTVLASLAERDSNFFS
jgi:hypothetical protein